MRADRPRQSPQPVSPQSLRSVLSAWLLAFGLLAEARGEAVASTDDLPRHPLELVALVRPDQVLKELPAEITRAEAAGDHRALALLHIAEANACRVLARWLCQRGSAATARAAAARAGDSVLQVRALILESRAVIALQDFTRGEELLGDAQRLLRDSPNAELDADIHLAYSSLSHVLGKHQLSADHAKRGIDMLGPQQALPLQARLLRNHARALAQLDQPEEARAALARGRLAAASVDDPKLSAELLLESARMARRLGDMAGQRAHIEAVLQLADQLANSQLYGQAQEALGLAMDQDGQAQAAIAHLRLAVASFAKLGQQHDELRALRHLVRLMVEQNAPVREFGDSLLRFIDLQQQVNQRDRAQAADDFGARMAYAEQRFDVSRLEAEARVAAEEAEAAQARERLGQALVAGALLLALATLIFWLQQRRLNGSLRSALSAVSESESRASELLRLTPGMVLLHDLEGRVLSVNPATALALQRDAGDLPGEALQALCDEASLAAVLDYLQQLHKRGIANVVVNLPAVDLQTSPRHLRLTGRVAGREGARPYVVGHAVDITDETAAARALREQSLQDSLTGCYNRRYLDELLAAPASAGGWAVINVDLDHFKQINDTQGHERGDQVLREVAEFFRQRIRAGDALVRVGGDEFLLLLHDADPSICQGLLQRLETERAISPCGYSLGHAWREDEEPLSATLARADQLMYSLRRRKRAAGNGRDAGAVESATLA